MSGAYPETVLQDDMGLPPSADGSLLEKALA